MDSVGSCHMTSDKTLSQDTVSFEKPGIWNHSFISVTLVHVPNHIIIPGSVRQAFFKEGHPLCTGGRSDFRLFHISPRIKGVLLSIDLQSFALCIPAV